jgi:hypothetical protein
MYILKSPNEENKQNPFPLIFTLIKLKKNDMIIGEHFIILLSSLYIETQVEVSLYFRVYAS